MLDLTEEQLNRTVLSLVFTDITPSFKSIIEFVWFLSTPKYPSDPGHSTWITSSNVKD